MTQTKKSRHQNSTSKISSAVLVAGALGAISANTQAATNIHQDIVSSNKFPDLRLASNFPDDTQAKPDDSLLYKVVAGDTLSALAIRYKTTVTQISSWNNLKSDMIYVGQILIVGKKSENPTPSSPSTHKVVAGDTLSGLAVYYKTSVKQLMSWNHLKSDIIYIGQELIVSEKSVSQPTPSTPALSTNLHKVVAGDTLSALALHYKTSVKQIISWNHLKSDIIYIGQELIVSQNEAGTPSAPSPTPAQTSHKVIAGDTLWGLSQLSGSSIEQIKNWNGLTNDTIYIGQTLRIK